MKQILFLVILVYLQVSTCAAYIIRCHSLPENTNGYWVCDPPITPGHTVQDGTHCQFSCNGTIQEQVYRCHGGWHPHHPEDIFCQGGITTYDPASTSTPKLTTTTPEPTTTTPKPTTSTPKPTTTTTPEPTTTTPEPTTSTPEPTTTTPKPTTSTPEPTTTTPEPTTSTPEPTTTTPKPTTTTTPKPTTNTPELTTTTLEPTTTTPKPSTSTPEPTSTTPEPTSTTPEPTTTTSKPTTTTFEPTTSREPSTTTTSGGKDCPFIKKVEARSIFCPQSFCPAVVIGSEGGFADMYPDLVGCYNYEGSLMGDQYPLYMNRDGTYLTPHQYSNPQLGFTHWLVSPNVMDTTGFLRNERHEDQFCPYDMHDGWEYLDPKDGSWKLDSTLTVICATY